MVDTSYDTVRARLGRYLDEGLDTVTGWFETDSAEVVAAILRHQLATDVRGDVAEIGVHHGKSFLLLANGVRDDERAVALDVFDDQTRNVDGSGRGDRGVLERNVAQWAPDCEVEVVQASSTDVAVADAASTFGRVRTFSVDGGHTSGITRHDLLLAETVLVDDGVVVLDDVLNPHWLGVLTGLTHYLAGEHRLEPFALSPNKLYLATPAAGPTYAAMLRETVPDLLGKRDVEMCGAVIDVYGLGSPRDRRRLADHAGLADEAARLRTELATAAASVATAEGRVAELQDAREAAGRRIEELALLLAEEKRARLAAERRIAAMTGSTSWRLTTPVRAASGWAKARRRG